MPKLSLIANVQAMNGPSSVQGQHNLHLGLQQLLLHSHQPGKAITVRSRDPSNQCSTEQLFLG